MKRAKDSNNYMRDKKNYIDKLETTKKNAYIHENENKIKNENKYGTQKDSMLITIGTEDRKNKLPPKEFTDESKMKAYNYGYYERGSVAIDGEITKGTYSEKELIEFGIYDCMYKIPLKYLKELLKHKAYEYGRNYQKGKETYDYTVSEGISFEEYIYSMELFFPEVKTEAFKEGFYQREKEILQNNKKSR